MSMCCREKRQPPSSVEEDSELCEVNVTKTRFGHFFAPVTIKLILKVEKK